MEIKNWLQDYKEKQRELLETLSVDKVSKIIEKFIEANKSKRQIFVFGNGGSASNSSHFVTDLGKSASEVSSNRFKCLSLNESISLITAISNDYSYEDVFVKQMENFANPGDIVFTMSVSGSSPNLVKAIEWANEKGLYTIALVGGKRGAITDMADMAVVIDSEHYGRVEDLHMMICHIIAYAFIENPGLTK